MTGVAEEQREQLEVWRRQYDGRPRDELHRLLLLALEREQLVAIAYRDQAVATRLRELDVPEDVREAFTQTLAWAWRDEQQHTVFTRGLLLGSANVFRRVLAWTQVVTGAVAGWASATQHHATWRRAPLARAVAGVVTTSGRVIGKVPRSMRSQLRHLDFESYCQLQCQAEISAAICWERMAELARDIPGFDEATADAFHQMWQHELRHREAFEVMARAMGRSKALCGDAADEIVDQLRSVGPMFVPRAFREGAFADHPLGRGGAVAVVDDSNGQSGPDALRDAVDLGGLRQVLVERSAAVGRPVAELSVLIKPAFMFAYDRRDPSVFTDPALVDALVAWLRGEGVGTIEVAESPNLYDSFYAGRSVAEVAAYTGMRGDYTLVDLTEELVDHAYAFGLGPTSISRRWRDADVRIAFPKLRSHPIDFAHLCLGGLEGVAGRIETYLFTERRAERETATLMPLVDHPPHFAIVDGWQHGADGLVGVIACRKPPRPHRIWAGRDALAVDIVTMRHLGLGDPLRCELIATAMTWFGDPRGATAVAGCDEPLAQWRHPYSSGTSALLALLAHPAFQFAGARGSVFTPPMDPLAFPSLRDESVLMRLRRSTMRRILGISAPALPPG